MNFHHCLLLSPGARKLVFKLSCNYNSNGAPHLEDLGDSPSQKSEEEEDEEEEEDTKEEEVEPVVEFVEKIEEQPEPEPVELQTQDVEIPGKI